MTQRVAIAGTGIRALGFAHALASGQYPSQLVGLYDLNPVRMRGFCDLLKRDVPSFTDLSALLASTRPDTLLICTPDHTHPELIEIALDAGLETITEKPMAIDRQGIARIARAEREHGRRVRVAFNMRFTPFAAQIKSILASGQIGRVRNVIAEWFIDRTHGIEYFRRWHADMKRSGGLLVHKATHHFDLLNWFVDDEPAQVAAMGSLEVFGTANAFRGERCRRCEHATRCWAAMPREAFASDRTEIDPSWTHLQKLYFDAEQADGYIRDNCVFRPQIDIYDTMSVSIRYRQGTQVVYGLNAYCPYQGFAITFNGTDGRLEAKSISPGTRSADMGDLETLRVIKGTNRRNIVQENHDMKVDTSPHAGGDVRMMRHLFGEPESGPDPLGQSAGSREGAYSALVGICANESIASGLPVEVPSLDELARSADSASAPVAASAG